MTRSDLIDVECEWRSERPAAIAVFNYDYEEPGSREIWVWLPKSQIEYDLSGDGKTVTVTLPEWLAIEKGLV